MRVPCLLGSVVFIAVSGHINIARAADASVQDALKSIGDMASSICQTVPIEQTTEGVALKGNVKAELGGLLKYITDAGISGIVDASSEHSVGVLQKDLARTIESNNNCKLTVFITLVPKLIPAGHDQANPGNDNQKLIPATPGFSGDAFWADNGDIFEHNGVSWTERTTDGRCCTFMFKEVSRTASLIELYDASRSMTLRLPIPSGISSWRQHDTGDWIPWLNVVHRG